MQANTSKYLIPLILIVITALTTASYAQNRVVVVPLLGDDGITPPANVVVVAKQNGDFADLAAALNSITDADRDNPYIIYIAPGVYYTGAPLQMKPYVNIVGSGKDTTLITGFVSSSAVISSSIMIGADNTELSHLTLLNQGPADSPGAISIGLFNQNTSPTVNNVSIEATGGSSANYGVYNTNGAAPKIFNADIKATSSFVNGNSVVGLINIESGGSFRDLTVTGDGADGSDVPRANLAAALSVVGPSLTEFESVNLIALDGTTDIALFATNATVEVTDGSNFISTGIDISAQGTSNVLVKYSDFAGGPASITIGSDTASVTCLFSTELGATVLASNCD